MALKDYNLSIYWRIACSIFNYQVKEMIKYKQIIALHTLHNHQENKINKPEQYN